ncbi:hypothetical protein T440DRAFT_469769 [Plenodomus tracheiphilus IPT5]|uniref:Zn(2)-C6 fungal-type domain-containing protein n=1 Tax=Plenodomus tracheiphilus IPT5 TaxID=1408161 RepID=A0A6A7B154_9PLEO|nr:hypothetical protein T440DRAFT_469769 [Plenodomus tracheiphilus IPT5]
MSYRGRPSKGCESCRARKVKCDEKKPICSRCVKSSIDCKYRDQGDLLFRNQTASAAQRAEESWRKRSKSNQREVSESSTSNTSPPSDESSPSATHQSNVGGQQSHHSSPHGSTDEYMHNASDVVAPIPDLADMHITSDVEPDLRQLAYERFVYDFVSPDDPNRPPEQPTDSLWAFMPVIYQNAAQGSCYRTVLDAVAYVNYANRCADPEAMALAEESMAKGINLISKSIADKKLAATDETLCAVYLLGVYENMTTVQRKGTFIAHQHGANALLQLRSLEQFFSNPISGKLYEVAYCQMLLGNLQAAKHPPLPIKDVVAVENYLSSLYTNFTVYVVRLIWREAKVHAQWHDIKRNSTLPTSRADLQDLLQSALDLDAAFQAWEADVPPAWRYHMEPNTPEARSRFESKWQDLVLTSNGAPPEIHLYPNLKRCWIWGFYRTTSMFLLRDILEMINWMFRLPVQTLEPSHNEAQANLDTFVSPYQQDPAHLDDMALRTHYAIATVRLIYVIEKSCSAILSNLTVPIIAKRDGDLSGMRGYISLWPLGIMDAILGSGLIPDSNAPFHTSDTHHPPPQVSPQSIPTPQQAPVIVATAPKQTSPPTPDSYATAPQFSELSKLPPKLPTEHSSSPPPLAPQALPHSSRPSSSAPHETARKGHIFDSSPAHRYDQPISELQYDASGHTIDVAARREWLNTLLYYIATDLGIKKAFYVPVTEGFMQKVKPKVDGVLGR